ncbi:MAG: VWA domain-containing protein [Verrucomicrobiota bacterium]
MNLYFANPLGWLGLLSLGPLVYLHFFRKQTRRRIVDTLFLIDQAAISMQTGEKLNRWRQSGSFWWQAAALLLISFLLAMPRWANEERVGKLAIVLDNSASMSAFRESGLKRIGEASALFEKRLSEVDYLVLESDSEGEVLYRGRSASDFLAALEKWRPRSGSHSFDDALGVARNGVGEGGFVLLLTDRPLERISNGARVIAVGEEIENVGVSGIRAVRRDGQTRWRAIVRNYGRRESVVDWRLQFGDRETPAQPIRLQGESSTLLEGVFPAEHDSLALVLEGDRFGLDDYAPLRRPKPKRLAVSNLAGAENGGLVEKLIGSFENVVESSDGEALFETASNPSEVDFSIPGVVFLNDLGEEKRSLRGRMAPSNHEYNREISWSGLIARAGTPWGSVEGDETLLWQGSTPLVFLRGRKLVFNFEPRSSNLDHLPAFVLVTGRYLEDLRSGMQSLEALNCDTGQVFEFSQGELRTVLEESGNAETVVETGEFRVRAPEDPGFFRIEKMGIPLVVGAARFGDAREADFRGAGSVFDLEDLDLGIVEEYYDDDFLSSVWLLGIFGLMLGAWYACHRENLG